METAVHFPTKEQVVRVLGPRDIFLRQLQGSFDVQIVARGHQLVLEGDEREVAACKEVLRELQERLECGEELNESNVERIIAGTKDSKDRPSEGASTRLASFRSGQTARPRTSGQAQYIETMLENDIVFCIGPAGTGKTYLAVAAALDYVKRGELRRIVLCRPAVEAGEHLGYLPGDLRSKVNPYLRPLYDALHDLMSPDMVKKYIDNDLIEILPLAFVRGRTLDNAFIILDEAQNCTVEQMKTFLTRLGGSAKLVVTGDITQIDLPHEERSGLVDVQERLAGIEGIGFVRLSQGDIVRHYLVRRIVDAYQHESGAEAGTQNADFEGGEQDDA
ncbi:MAG: PhoH family protein [Planctomycetes bacterium]|nr:PhoH family protein [Planctomycetota bacterium]